jgi:hypothetical protein
MRITCYLGNQEATIEELLNDPIAELLRRRDGLTLEQVRDCIAGLRCRSATPVVARSPSQHCLPEGTPGRD